MFLDVDTFSTVISSTPLISIDLIVKNKSKKVLLGKRVNEPAFEFWFVPGERVFKDESLSNFRLVSSTMKKKKIPFMNLQVNDAKERKKLNETFVRLMNHGQYMMGQELDVFEKKIADYCHRKYCVGVSSGTASLYISLKSMNIGEDDEVITTSLSWVATANAIAMTGATAVFADIDSNLNINTDSVERLISKKTKVIMPVHYTGRVADLDSLLPLAKKHGIKLLCDSSQAFGSMYEGKPVGAFGDVSCFSMNPMKILGACGEAGAILTDDKALYERMKILRYNGTINKETCIEPSYNGRLDALQAAILVDRLDFLEEKIKKE